MLEELNKRQQAILELAISTGSVTNRQVQEKFGVVQDTALRELKLLLKQGKGRSTHYVPKSDKS
ncbi:MAG: hypothetical protein KDK99_04295 [Verrucomicrobiales bacterium]|nr:hypothetical protein [Verrucomicrobiales bacterium]